MGIEVQSISKSFGSSKVLKEISFSIPKGETTILLGASGAGKSTLLRMLNLLETPDTGSMNIAGLSFQFHSEQFHNKQSRNKVDKQLKQQACSLRKKVGMVFQQYNLWPHMTVLQNLIEAPIVQGVPKHQAVKQARELLQRMELGNKAEAWPSSLSGGQQQRVAIARALMLSPEILLFDEPTAALDPAITNQVVDIIKELSDSGITIVVVTHEVEFAKKVGSRVIYLEDGHIVEDGPASRFFQPETAAFKAFLEH